MCFNIHIHYIISSTLYFDYLHILHILQSQGQKEDMRIIYHTPKRPTDKEIL